MRLAQRIEREQLTAVETERLIRAGRDLSKAVKETPRSPPRKHVRIATKFGVVQRTPDACDFDDRLLIAMLHEAGRELVGK